MRKIERGDTVRLNSGGPDMLVRFLKGDACICEWQGANELPDVCYFTMASLTLVRRGQQAA